MHNQEFAVVTGSANRSLSEELARRSIHIRKSIEAAELQVFKDGELNIQLMDTIRGKRVFLIQSTYTPADNIWELLLMIDASKRAGAKDIIVVMPYAGYSRQERKDENRSAIGAAVLAKCIVQTGATHVLTFDLHTTAIEGLYDGLPFNNIQGIRVFRSFLQNEPKENLMFCSPDIGGIKRTKIFAKEFGCPWMACNKERVKANEVSDMELMGDPKGKHIILVDDIADTLNTTLKASALLMANGALSVRAIVTHALMSDNAYEALEKSTLTQLIISDTIPLKKTSSKIKVVSIVDVLADVINRIATNESLSE